MSTLAKAIRSRRETSRTRRAVNRAIEKAVTPSLRDELIQLSQRSSGSLR